MTHKRGDKNTKTFSEINQQQRAIETERQHTNMLQFDDMFAVRKKSMSGAASSAAGSHDEVELPDWKPRGTTQLTVSNGSSVSAASSSGTNGVHFDKPTFPITSLSIFPKTSNIEIQAIWNYATHVMPECAERTLVRLLAHYTIEARLQKARKTAGASASASFASLDLNIETELALLEEQIKQEDHINITHDIRALKVNLAAKKAKTVLQEIQAMLRKVRPLDMNTVVNKVQAASGEVAAMAGQDVILTLGVTGSGKSTTLLSLAGVEMVKTHVDDLKHIGPSNGVPASLERIVSSPSSDSVTQSITTVRLPGRAKLLGDTPGFGDTGGPEIDLAHAGVMLNGAQSARSITPLITISKLSLGDRIQELPKLLHTIAAFILNLEVHSASFFYVFSKFDEGAEEELKACLRGLRRSLKERRGDRTVILFLENMIAKLESGQGAAVIDPFKNNAAILDQIIDFPSITNPRHAFANFASTETMRALNEQLVQQAKGIQYAIKSNNIGLLNFRLHQLRALQSHLKLAVVDEAVENNVAYVADVLKAKEQEFLRLLTEGSTATHFESANELMQQIMQFDIIRQEHLMSHGHFEREMPREVCLEQEKLLLQIKSVELFSTPDLARRLEKMDLIAKNFSTLTPTREMFNEAFDYLNDHVDFCKRRANGFIESNQLEHCMLEMERLTFAAKYFTKFCVKDVNNQIEQVKRRLCVQLTQNLGKVERLFSQENLSNESEIDEIASIFTFVAAAQHSAQLKKYVTAAELNDLLQPFNTICIRYFEKIEVTIKDLCQTQPIDFEKIFSLLSNLAKLNEIDAIKSLGLTIYHRILSQLKDIIQEIQHNANTFFEQFCSLQEEGAISLALEKFSQCVGYLYQAKPFFDQDPTLDIQAKVQTYLTQVKLQVSTITDFNQVKQADNLIHRVELLKNSCADIEDINDSYARIQTCFHDAINLQLQRLYTAFSLEFDEDTVISSAQFTPWLNALNYLTACDSIGHQAIEAENAAFGRHVAEFISRYFEAIDALLTNAFEEVKLKLAQPDLVDRGLAPQSRMRLILNHLLGLQHLYQQFLSVGGVDSALHSQLFTNAPQALLEGWVQNSDSRLIGFHAELNESFARSDIESGDDERENIIRVTHMFSELDEFLMNSSKHFSELALKFRADTLKFNSDAMNAARDYVENKRYAEAKDSFISLRADAKNHLTNKTIQTLITRHLNDEVASLRSRVQSVEVNVENVQLLMADFHVLNGAKEHLMSFVRVVKGFEERFVADLEDILTHVQARIAAFIQHTGELIAQNHFDQAEQVIKNISAMSILFKGTFYQNKLTLTKRVIEDKIQKQLTKALAFYDKVFGSSLELEEDSASELPFDITRLSELKPIEFFAELERGAAEANRAMYDRTAESLTRMLIVNINHLLNYLIKTAAPEIAAVQLNLIETQVSRWLPPALYQEFAHLLEGCRTSINERNRVHVERSQDIRAQNDIAEWLGYMQYNSKRKYYQYVLDAVAAVDNKFNLDIDRFNSILRSGDPKRILELLSVDPKLQDEWVKWSDYAVALRAYLSIDEPISNIAGMARVYREIFNKKFQSFKQGLLENFHEVLRQINTSDLSQLTVENTVVYVKTMQAFLTLKHTHLSMHQDLNSKLEAPIQGALLRLVGFLVENQQQLTDAIETKNFTLLRECMDAAKEMDSLHDSANRLIASRLCDSMPALKTNIALSHRYDQKKEQFAAAVQEWRDFLLQEFLGNEQRDTFNEDDQNSFYKELFAVYMMMRELHHLQQFLPLHVNINEIMREVDSSLDSQLGTIKQRLVDLLTMMPSEVTGPYETFGVVYSHLRACADHFADDRILPKARSMKQDISDIMQGKILDIEAQAKELEGAEPDQVLRFLLNLQSMATHIPQFRQQLEDCIDRILQYYDRQTVHIMSPLAAKVFAGEDHASQMLRQRPYFAAFRVADRNQKTKGCDIDEVLAKLRGVNINQDKLRDKYNLFMREYTNLYEEAIKTPAKSREIIENARLILSGTASIHDKILSLITHIFASWTLQSAQYYERYQSKNFLMQPHPAQLVAIFRAFGLDQDEPQGINDLLAMDQLWKALKNNLSEVKTGEGKSVILMVIAMVLGMFGVHADCACYSADLSERDFNDAKQVVRDYDLGDFVHYGTLEALSEQYINRNGNVRDQIRDLINDTDHVAEINRDETPRVLLLDEFDTLLKQGFLGSAYAPVTILQGQEIRNLILLIWANRDNEVYLKPSYLKTTSAYQACCAKYADWAKLIDAAMKNMVDAVKKIAQDVRNGVKPDYLIDQGKIVYLSEHGVSSTASYGYETMFAYLKESMAESRLVSADAVEEHLGLYVNAGLLSYAHIPQNGYKRTLGVTATLQQLTTVQESVLRDYHIHSRTFIPSAYGDSKLIFREDSPLDVQVASNRAAHFSAITNEIKARSATDTRYDDRPVIIFFETRQKLEDYYNHLKNVDKSIAVGRLRLLTEELSLNAKNQVINLAGTRGTVTLAVGSFGRGTDFKCTDGRLDGKGGVHVINTQLQAEVENTQTKGRTARQANQGTYSLVLNQEDLVKFDITQDDIDSMDRTGRRYEVLARKVNAFYEAQDNANIQAANDLVPEHDKTREVFIKLARRQRSDLQDVKDFLLSQNKAPRVDPAKSRVLCLVDATGSMGGVLNDVKDNLSEMLRRVKEVLAENDCSTIVEFQLAFYRNYDSGVYVLQHSAWSHEDSVLNRFLAGIGTNGGLGNEAIEVALYHANKEVEAGRAFGVETKVMLIGDNPPNTEAQYNSHRGYYGTGGYPDVRPYQVEISALKQKGITVDAFFKASGSYAYYSSSPYYDRGTETNSRAGIYQIARQSGGKSADLTTAASLIDAVTEQLLTSAAGDDHDRAAELVASYRRKYNTGGAGFFSATAASAAPPTTVSAVM